MHVVHCILACGTFEVNHGAVYPCSMQVLMLHFEVPYFSKVPASLYTEYQTLK